MRKIKVGVIGTGFIGPCHIESMRRLGFVDVVALASSNQDRANAKAEVLSVPKAYGDWRELIADPEVEVVDICTANVLHYPMAKAALEAGKHVICEKPLAMNSHETADLARIAREKGLVNAVTFNHRFYPLVQEARELLSRKDLGDIFIVRGGFLQDWLLYDTDYNWRVEAAQGGAPRAVGDIGSHWLDTIQYITGLTISSVYADFGTFIPVRKRPLKPVDTFANKELRPEDSEERVVDTEDYATVLLRFKGSQAKGVMTVSQVSAGRKCQLVYEINGSKASLGWDSERPNELWRGSRDTWNGLLVKDPSLMQLDAKKYARYPGGHAEGFPDSHTGAQRAVYEYIRDDLGAKGGKPEFATFETGHHEQVLCEAILTSAIEGRWVEVTTAR